MSKELLISILSEVEYLQKEYVDQYAIVLVNGAWVLCPEEQDQIEARRRAASFLEKKSFSKKAAVMAAHFFFPRRVQWGKKYSDFYMKAESAAERVAQYL